MAVLSDRDIRAAVQAGRVRIDPYDTSCLQPSSVDLHLDREFRVFRNNRYPYIDVRQPQPDLTEIVAIGTQVIHGITVLGLGMVPPVFLDRHATNENRNSM